MPNISFYNPLSKFRIISYFILEVTRKYFSNIIIYQPPFLETLFLIQPFAIIKHKLYFSKHNIKLTGQLKLLYYFANLTPLAYRK